MKSGRRVGRRHYWVVILVLAAVAVVLPTAIAVRDWITVALLALSALVLLPIIALGIIAILRREPAADFPTMAIRWLSSKAQRALALIVVVAAVSLWGILAGKGRGVAIGVPPMLLFLVALLVIAVRSEGWSGGKTRDH